MNAFRSTALTLLACAATVSVTACTAGLTTASSPATSPAATSASNASSPRPAVAASTVAVSGALGSFPVPAGAKVAENVATSQEIIIFFGSITPAKVSAFYATALPRAGYTVTGNSLISLSGVNEALIQFSGHGYKGNIAALATFNDTGVSIAGLGHKNVTNITLQPQ